MNTEHHAPWSEAREELHRDILPRLIKDGKQIGKLCLGGSYQASKVIELYSRLYQSFDPMTFQELKEAIVEMDKVHIFK